MAAQGGNCTSHIGRIYNGMATTGSRIVSVYVWLQIQSTSSGPQPTSDTKVFPRQECAWYFNKFWLHYSSENFFKSLNLLTTLAYLLHYLKTVVEEPLWYTEFTRLGFHPSEHKATERVLNLNLATNICRYVRSAAQQMSTQTPESSARRVYSTIVVEMKQKFQWVFEVKFMRNMQTWWRFPRVPASSSATTAGETSWTDSVVGHHRGTGSERFRIVECWVLGRPVDKNGFFVCFK